MSEKKQPNPKQPRTYTVSMPGEVADEIRSVAKTLGVPVGTVRDIVAYPAESALAKARGSVRRMVADHFSKLAAGG